MCITCGCSVAGVPFRELKLGMAPLPDVPEFSLENAALRAPGRDAQTLHLETQILGKNQRIAQRNRSRLTRDHILALNLVSSPGAGKTTLLERTLTDLKDDLNIAVIEGDQATSNDAERIRATGVKAVQINTGTGCHLEADMVERAFSCARRSSISGRTPRW
jgi:hydrogenase nickel incorporation protein HypB